MLKEDKTDLRVIRTKASIKAAVKALIMNLDASKITVQGVAQKAMINRKTFYLHYSCIEDLFDQIFQELVIDYASFMDQYPLIHSFKDTNNVFFEFMAKQEPYMERLVCSDSYQTYSNRFFEVMLKRNRSLYNPYKKYNQEEQNIINTFLGISSVNIYRQWVKDGKKIPIQRLIDLTSNLFTEGVNSLDLN